MYLDHITIRLSKVEQRRAILATLKRECRGYKPRAMGFQCSVHRSRVFHLATTDSAIAHIVHIGR